MEELKLAIEFLNKRALKNTKINRYVGEVIPASEVQATLQMVLNGEFIEFSNKMKNQGHPHFQ